jgi:C4-dicarboxylate-specific signal transduction histidine kinase
MEDTARAERSLRLRTFTDGTECVALVVQDTGSGLDPAIADHLFEPFVTTKKDGLGLGLCISHRIVAMHRGRLWASQDAERGAVFHMSVPIRQGNTGHQ